MSQRASQETDPKGNDPVTPQTGSAREVDKAQRSREEAAWRPADKSAAEIAKGVTQTAEDPDDQSSDPASEAA